MKTRNLIMAAVLGLATMNVGAANAVENTNGETLMEMTVAPTVESTGHLVDFDHYDRVQAYSTDRYTQTFYAGESVWIYVSGDGDTDLDLYVYDASGNLMDSDTDSSDDCLCIFTPRRTGTFTIKVKNLGGVYNNYRIIVLQ